MKVAFFHPYKMADHYFVEAVETATIADLCADGHVAEAVDYLFDPSRPEDEQIREVKAALAEAAYDVIFLERPWSDAMVRALSGLNLVAYGRPELVESGLVDKGIVGASRSVARAFVRALASGADLGSVAGVTYRAGGEVRETQTVRSSVLRDLADATFAHGRRRFLSKGRANVDRAIVVSNLGCAYRNVPNRTGVFDNVPLPADVSTAGCTFCEVDAYERMTEGEAIALLVRQVEAVLRDRPEVREIAVKDDYAVRFLGALGDALRPLGLGDREVLLSARAEYLLQFRTEIEEALAGGFPTPIGFYLIGFENFSQAELDRFNKGMGAAQLELVLDLMREWSERFPGRFRVTPTGGFILFTPWTTLEDLRINASAIRRLGFERYRGRALLSQLRLYPHLPLYWLAKRDGLLIDAFADDEMSDAHRRGYQADHAWRFRDAKAGEVYRRLFDARTKSDDDLFAIFEDALDDAAGIARGKKNRPLRMVRAPRDRKHAQPASHSISLNRGCNQNCGFCAFRGPDLAPARVRAARAVQAVRAAAHAGARTIVITGAEPLLEWYLKDLVKLARDLGVPDVVIETNATLVEEQGGGLALAAAGVTRAVVAFNAVDPALSDAITRDPGGHARTIRGVRDLLGAGVPVELAVALLPENRGALAAVVRQSLVLFPTARAGVEAVVARYIPAGPHLAAPLSLEAAASEFRSGAEAAALVGCDLRAAPGGELPACVFPDTAGIRSVLRLGEVLVTRDGANYQRISACSACTASAVCPGPLRGIADAVAAVARPLSASSHEIVPVSEERGRALQEFKSQFFLTAPDGSVRERRIVRVNFHCNQACDFCFVSRELPAIDHDLIVRELTEVAERKAVLDLSGGEPTLNPRLAEYIALAGKLGIEQIELQTNAIKMADAGYARALSDAGLRAAFVSLHGTSAAVSDRVTASPGTFARTVDGIRNLRAVGVRVRLNFVLCGYNVAELAEFPDFIERSLVAGRPGPPVDMNFSFVAASTDNVPRDTGLIPRFSDVAWALAAAHERACALGLSISGFDSKCGVPACYMPSAIRETHFAADIPPEELSRATGFTKSDACARCELDRRCYGIRSTYAELYGTGELRPITGGERAASTLGDAPGRAHRGTVWAAIGLAPSHALRPAAVANLEDDAAFALPTQSWSDLAGGSLDREVVQLVGGLREVIKVERSSVIAAEESAAAFRARGFVARVYTGPRGPGGSAPRAIAFVGREREPVDTAMALEPGLIADRRERGPLVTRMGELLGYPSCCVSSFAAAAEQDDNTHIARLSRAHRGALAPEQNWAAVPIRPFSHFPCSPTCVDTARLGRETLALCAAERPLYRAALDRALRSVALIQSADRFVLLLGARADGPDAFTYDGVLSHKNLGMDAAVLARPSFRAFYLEIISTLEEGRRVVRSRNGLIVECDGRAIGDIAFTTEAPLLLDFTAVREARRLPLAAAP